MNMNKHWVMVVLVAALAATPVFADIAPIGDPVVTGSWRQRFQFTYTGFFNQMEIFMSPGVVATFETSHGNGFTAFNQPGWNNWLPDPGSNKHAVAWGTSTGLLRFDINFSPDLDTPLAFDFVAWNNGTRVNATQFGWSGSPDGGGFSSWAITAGSVSTTAHPQTAVSEGFTWPLMAASSLIALVGLARRRARGC